MNCPDYQPGTKPGAKQMICKYYNDIGCDLPTRFICGEYLKKNNPLTHKALLQIKRMFPSSEVVEFKNAKKCLRRG